MARSKQRHQTKRLKGKGGREWRDCLGWCNKKFLTTPDTRFCESCRKQRDKIDAGEDYSVAFNNEKGSKE